MFEKLEQSHYTVGQMDINTIQSIAGYSLLYGNGTWKYDKQHKVPYMWHHEMETLAALLALCEGNPMITVKWL